MVLSHKNKYNIKLDEDLKIDVRICWDFFLACPEFVSVNLLILKTI